MTNEELLAQLNEVKDFIVVKGGRPNKQLPQVQAFMALYKRLKGKPIGEGTCTNCIIDGFFELMNIAKTKKIETMTGKHKVKKMFDTGHRHYTNANMTDKLAVELVRGNRRLAGYFEDPDALLAEVDNLTASVAVAEVKTVEPPLVTKVVSETETKTVTETTRGKQVKKQRGGK